MRGRLASALIAAGLVVPAAAFAVMLTSVEVYRAVEPSAPLFGGPPPGSLAESILGGYGVEETYQFIRAGGDPNAPVRVAHEDYTGRVAIDVSPLMLAVAVGDSSAVRMLLSFGARLDLPQNRPAECLAREIQHREIEAVLVEQREEGSPQPACDGRPADAPTALVAWAATVDEADAPDRR